jgi:hypothetical protein
MSQWRQSDSPTVAYHSSLSSTAENDVTIIFERLHNSCAPFLSLLTTESDVTIDSLTDAHHLSHNSHREWRHNDVRMISLQIADRCSTPYWLPFSQRQGFWTGRKLLTNELWFPNSCRQTFQTKEHFSFPVIRVPSLQLMILKIKRGRAFELSRTSN